MATSFNNLCRDLIGGSLQIKGKLVIDEFCNIITNNTVQAANIIGETFCGNAQLGMILPKIPGGFVTIKSNIFSDKMLNVETIISGNIFPRTGSNNIGSETECWQEIFTSNLTCDIIQSKTTGFIQVNGSFEPFEDCIFDLGTTSKAWGDTYMKNVHTDCITALSGNMIDITSVAQFLGDLCVDGNIKTDSAIITPNIIANLCGNAAVVNISPISKSGGLIIVTGDINNLNNTITSNNISVINNLLPQSTGTSTIGTPSLCFADIFTINLNCDIIESKTTGFVQINGTLEPFASDTFDLGSLSQVWSNTYSRTVNTDCIQSIGSGPLELKNDTNVTGDLCISGMIKFGSGAVTSVNGDTGPVVTLDTDDIPEGGTNLYYTDARVSANPDVLLNTEHRNTVPSVFIYGGGENFIIQSGNSGPNVFFPVGNNIVENTGGPGPFAMAGTAPIASIDANQLVKFTTDCKVMIKFSAGVRWGNTAAAFLGSLARIRQQPQAGAPFSLGTAAGFNHLANRFTWISFTRFADITANDHVYCELSHNDTNVADFDITRAEFAILRID